MKKFLAHPLTQKTRRILRRVVIVAAVILAVVFVLTLSVDLGPVVREQAERGASAFLERPVHIGRMSVRLWNGKYVLEDFVIDGLTSESPPFLEARRIAVSMLWNTLTDRRVVFDDIEMTDWKMYVENRRDGRNSFPRFNRGGGGERRWTVTMQYVRAHRGEFVYDDQTTPWRVITRNLDVTVARPSNRYVGSAKFSNGTVTIQNYLPFRADMDSRFTIDGGRVVLDPITLTTDGTRSVLKGDVNLNYWPEQMYSVKSEIDLPRMREIFFADDEFTLSGTGHFDGVFHLFKDFRPDRTQRTGRELKGTFTSDVAGVNSIRFEDLDGLVRWVPESLTFTEATTRLFGGTARLDYRMSPLGSPDTRPTHRFTALYDDIDLTAFSGFMDVQGLRLAGRASGRNLLEWPSGNFAARHGEGEIRVTPPAGATLMTRTGGPGETSGAGEAAEDGPVSPRPSLAPPAPLALTDPVPIGGSIVYAYEPDRFDLAPSRFATESTLVEFRGRTFNGERSNIPFHVSSADWQESDRLLAGLMTAFGNSTRPIPIGGSGTFDGLMSGAFRTPRIEGTFNGERIQAFDVVWGAVTGDVVIQNSYADVKNVVMMSGASTIRTDGRYSLGYPRRDGGEQINAHVVIDRRPVSDLRYAFELDEYDLDGTLSGEFTLEGDYTAPFGSGMMRIEQGVAYGEPFEEATAGIRLEGNGVRLDDIQMRMAGTTGEGAAFIGWNGTYSFDFGADSLEIERLAVTQGSTLPLSGLLDFTATGSGSFDAPRYEVRGRMRDVFVGDEGVGEIVGTLSMVDGRRMNVKLDASSARLAVSASGAIAVTPDLDAELTFVVTETSLDPYIRVFQPRLSPFTTAIASGRVTVTGKLANIDELVVDTSVDTLDLRLFDYQLRNPVPIRMVLDGHSVQIRELRLVGQDTDFNLTGTVGLHDEPSTPADERRIALMAEGNANLSILQGFFRNVQSRGRAALQARLEGPLADPVVIGRMTMENGRIRHFGFPHALDGVAGVLSFDTRGIRLDEVSARLGQGSVQFGGTIGIAEYRLGGVDVTITGRDMQLRDFPEGMRSRVDADLEVQGTSTGLTVSGRVQVLNARYVGDFDTAGMFGGGNGGPPTAASFTAPVIPIQYDVQISAMSTLQVNNDLMRNIVGSADLRLAGTYDRPLLFGRVDIERGEINYDAKRYVIRSGTIDFNNPTRIQPFLDVETEARVRVPGETYRVTVRATGLLPEPTLAFSSEPPLPEDEILALLAADVAPGRDVEARRYAAVTPQEQLLREQAARGIAGLATGELSRAVEDAIGVDFRVTPTITNTNPASTSVDPGVRFVIARQQGRVYFTYSRSTSATRDQLIQVEISQTDDISWILSRNEDGTYALDVQIRRTF